VGSTSRTGGRVTQDLASAQAARLEREPIGGYLRLQRELRGISAEELASLTRIPLRSLARLEAGSFDNEVDGFVRGFVRTVAEALGLDPDETLSRMLTEPRPEELTRHDFARPFPRALAGLLALVALVALVGVVRFALTSEPASVTGESGEEILYRRDPVRALAESDAASPAPLVAPEVEADADPEARAGDAAPSPPAAAGAVDVAAPPPLP